MVLNYREIIGSAWAFTQNNKKLNVWFSFFPALLTTIVGIVYVTYQFFSFKNSVLFGSDYTESFTGMVMRTSFNFLQSKFEEGLLIGGIILVIILLYLFIPTLFQGGLMQLTARLHNHQDVKLSDGAYYGFISFLPLFEYHVMVKAFSFVGIFTELSFVIRNLGLEWFKALVWVFALITIVGLILSILFIYTEYFIVIDKQGVIASIVASLKLVLRHWQETILILIIMGIITLQIFFRVAMVILIPVIITFSTSYLITFSFLQTIGIYIGLSLGLIALLFAAYLGGTINVFATSVWVQTFLKLTSQQETSAREYDSSLKKKTEGISSANTMMDTSVSL